MVENGDLGFLPGPVTGLVEDGGVVLGPGGKKEGRTVSLPKLCSSDQALIQVECIITN